MRSGEVWGLTRACILLKLLLLLLSERGVAIEVGGVTFGISQTGVTAEQQIQIGLP